MKLYGYARSSSAWRVRIALHLARVPYEHVLVHLAKGEQRAEAHASRNPMQQVPTFEWTEPDGTVRRLSQSMAILWHLDTLYPEAGLIPRDPYLGARAIQLAEVINSFVQPMQNMGILLRLTELGVDAKGWAREHVERGLAALEREASDPSAGQFLVGDAPTVADIFLVPQLENARRLGIALDPYPRLTAIDARCAPLPSFLASHPEGQPDYVPD